MLWNMRDEPLRISPVRGSLHVRTHGILRGATAASE